MEKPTVSVIMPVYNGERYLERSLDSVLAQEYADYEFLICDDGSTDDTMRIAESKHDIRIRFFKNKTNLGLFKTLNKLIMESRGEYIRLWSSDDIMRPNCLGSEVDFYKHHPEIGFCYCARDIINEPGRIVFKARRDKTPDVVPPTLAAQIMFYHGSMPGNIATAMIKNKVLKDLGLFREDMAESSDFEMWVRISAKYPIGFIRKSLIELRSHAGQESRKRGAGLLFMREDQEIIAALIKRLPSEIVPYARVYNRWHRHTQYVHYMVRCFLSRDFKIAVQSYQEICKIDNPLLVIGLWFFTVNGRLFRKKPRFI